jgi:hypothetical protein
MLVLPERHRRNLVRKRRQPAARRRAGDLVRKHRQLNRARAGLRRGIEMIAPHRSNRGKPPAQDRRKLSRYMRRWRVERFFAWIQWQRRILIRWKYYAHNFLGFVQLACLVILFKRF